MAVEDEEREDTNAPSSGSETDLVPVPSESSETVSLYYTHILVCSLRVQESDAYGADQSVQGGWPRLLEVRCQDRNKIVRLRDYGLFLRRGTTPFCSFLAGDVCVGWAWGFNCLGQDGRGIDFCQETIFSIRCERNARELSGRRIARSSLYRFTWRKNLSKPTIIFVLKMSVYCWTYIWEKVVFIENSTDEPLVVLILP